MKPLNAMEQRVVDAVLTELRDARKKVVPVTIIIDPYFDGTGGYILASSDANARRYTFEAPKRKKRPK